MSWLARLGLSRSSRGTSRILILVPYFGPWPEWIEFFLVTCRWNRTIDWLFLGDHGPPGKLAANLSYRELSLGELGQMVEQKLGVTLELPNGYKVCDLRLAFGTLFDEHLRRYDHFGWSDIDVIYGDLRRHLPPEMLAHDVVTFNEAHLSGHFTLVRNDKRGRSLHRALGGFTDRIGDPEYQHLDEPEPSALRGVRVHARESFNTPLSKLIPWRGGDFVFPSEWRWHQGRLTNDLDGDQDFLYLHFMHWKGGWWPRECGNAQWEALESVVNMDPGRAAEGFRVDAKGFHDLARAFE